MIEVRTARQDELTDVGALTVAAYDADGYLDGDAEYRAELADAADRAQQAELLVAVEDGRLLGTVTVSEPGTRYAEVSAAGELEFRMLAVATSARGRGVGEALVRAVVGRAERRGRAAVVMVTMAPMRAAQRLYSRLGFRRTPELDFEPVPGVVLLALRRDLTGPAVSGS